jgi:hypothetical protein
LEDLKMLKLNPMSDVGAGELADAPREQCLAQGGEFEDVEEVMVKGQEAFKRVLKKYESFIKNHFLCSTTAFSLGHHTQSVESGGWMKWGSKMKCGSNEDQIPHLFSNHVPQLCPQGLVLDVIGDGEDFRPAQLQHEGSDFASQGLREAPAARQVWRERRPLEGLHHHQSDRLDEQGLMEGMGGILNSNFSISHVFYHGKIFGAVRKKTQQGFGFFVVLL